MRAHTSTETLVLENNALRTRLEEAEEMVRAISSGAVDAFLVQKGSEEQVLVLDGVDKPYRLLIERMAQAAVTLTEDGTIIYTNRRLSDLLGESTAILVGAELADYLQPADLPAFRTILAEADDDAQMDATLRGPNGTLIPVHLAAATLLKPPRILSLVITDLREQKRQEAERLAYIEEQAARKVAETVADSLREADRRKDEFLAMLAHELRSPLAPIRNGLEILERISSQEPEVVNTRKIMARQVESLVRMVDDLLDASRVSQGKIELQRERIDLRAAVTRALESCQSYIEKRQQKIVVDLPDQPIHLQGDAIRIAQAIINLLSNASKFTPAGGEITLSVRREGDQALIAVRDNGMGIRPDLVSRIFELFAQANPTMGRTEGGLGIGLTLSRRLVELHGGTLEGASEGINKGSEFTIRLPIEQAVVRTGNSGSGQDDSAPVTSRRVLVVDDNRDAAESLTLLLSILGHVSQTELSGENAVRSVREFKPDLVLLDIGMPGMSGYEIANLIRQQPDLASIRVVAVSGYGSERHRQRSLSTGFDGHLVKPVGVDQLQELLKSL